MTQLADRAKAYETIVVSPRDAIARRKTLTALLKREVKAAMDLMREALDPAFLIYRESEPEFYLGYRNARNIIDLPTRSRGELEGVTTESGEAETTDDTVAATTEEEMPASRIPVSEEADANRVANRTEIVSEYSEPELVN